MQEVDLYSEYSKAHTHKFRVVREILDEHKSHFRWSAEEVVLDVGCGPGDLTQGLLYPWLPETSRKTVLGVDITPAMKEVGNTKFKQPGIYFETLDIADPNAEAVLKDNKFSGGFSKIFSFYVLHWLNDLPTGLENMYKLLKPNGQALLSFPVSRQYQRLYKQMQEREPWSSLLKGEKREIPNYFLNGDPKEEFISLVKEAGFKVVKCQCTSVEDEFSSLDVLKKLIGSLDIHFNKIPSEMQPQYLEECAEIMKQHGNLVQSTNGKVIIKENQIVAFLEK